VSTLDVVSLIILVFFVLLGLGFVLLLGYLPGSIAKRHHSPWAEAINVCGWAGILLPPLWFGALIWAFLRPRSGEGASVTISEAEAADLAVSVSDISARLAKVEQVAGNEKNLREEDGQASAALKDTQDALALALVKYNVGQTDLSPMLQIQYMVIGSQMASASVQYELIANRINLYLALGGAF
jgi:hypothetical protein